MKKIITSAMAFAVCLTTFAEGEKSITWPNNTNHQVKPVATMTVTVSDATVRDIKLGSYKGGEYMAVDFGDGKLIVTDQLLETSKAATKAVVSGIAKGNGTITIYAENADDIWYFGTDTGTATDAPITSINITSLKKVQQLAIQNAAVKTIDISNCDSLRIFNSFNGELTSMDFSKNAELTNIDVQGNKLTAINTSKNAKLTNLTVKNNLLTSIDVSANPVLNYLYAQDNKIKSAKVIVGIAYNTLNLQNNELEGEIILPETKYVYLKNNNLTSVKANYTISNLDVINNNISSITVNAVSKSLTMQNNRLTIATIPTKPAAMSSVKNYRYSPQAPMEVTVKGNVVDLSSQLTAQGELTVSATTNYAFVTEKNEALKEGEDYTIANGVATFLKEFKNIHCVMTSDAFPKAIGDDAFTTVPFSIADPAAINAITADAMETDIYNMNGVKASDNKGLKIQNRKKIYNK